MIDAIDSILVGTGPAPVSIILRMANRHGLVAGATGTGKTVTLQRLAEQFSRAGVPVFLADVKGDLAGISQAGGGNQAVAQRVAQLGLEQSEGFAYAANPVMFWDILGQQGHPVRTTISELGPLLLGRLLGLNEVQEGVLNIVFQSPLDVPETVLGQLGNRVQHALRAFTPKDQQAVRVAAQTFRPNPALDTQAVITALGVGEALVSTLDGQGVPGIVQRVTVAPPGSRLGPVTAAERQSVMDGSLVKGVYDVGIDRVSAYEQLAQRATEAAGAAPGVGGWRDVLGGVLGTGGGSRSRQTPLEAFATSAARSLGSQIGRQLVRGVMGSLFGTKTGGRG